VTAPQRTTPGRPDLVVYAEEKIRAAVMDRLALASAEHAFSMLARAEATVPPPMSLELARVGGEVHVKGAAVDGSSVFAVKVATGFYRNAEMGLPSGSGLVLVLDARTGFPLAVLADNGYLTDLRTAAAGALAARHLAPERPLSLALVGAGVQARLQARLIGETRDVASVRVWSRSEASRSACAREVAASLGVEARAYGAVEDAVAGADLVVTVTPSRTPLVSAGMLGPGATAIAVGSDGPDKRELDSRILAQADKVVTDLTAQCARLGELHHAIAEGAMSEADVHAELGHVVVGEAAGRERDDELIVCDLTGVGIQDAAIAEAAYRALSGT
jgi:ornithine cyclodeaminase/alanine dehydrogenase-like protein (mu-crystallin family)